MGLYIRSKLPLLIGAVVAVLLQLIVSPFITIGYAMPNFILVFCVVGAIAFAANPPYLTAFFLGLIYDLAGSGPVGAMACLCVAVTFTVSALFSLFDNDSLFIPIILIVLCIFAVEMLYALLMITCVVDVSLLDAFIYRVLPCALYDTVLALLLFPVAMRTVARKASANGMPIIH